MVDSTTGSNNIALGFGAGFNLISGIEAREGSSRHDVSLPEQEHHAAPVEVVCRIGERLFAFEHTRIEFLGSAATRVGRQRSQAAHFYSWNPALRCWTTAAAQPRWLPYRPGDLLPHRGRTVLICKTRQADGDKLVFATIKPRWYPTWLGV
jgi:hypothetical protein